MKSTFCQRLYILSGILAFAILVSSFTISMDEDIKLDLNFSGLDEHNDSQVMIAVYADSNNFLSEKPFKTFKVATNSKTSFSHQINLPEGEYGIALFQDLNGDEKLNKNFVGYPTEPFAFSNNAPVNFGPPKWKDAVFKLVIDRSMDIKF